MATKRSLPHVQGCVAVTGWHQSSPVSTMFLLALAAAHGHSLRDLSCLLYGINTLDCTTSLPRHSACPETSTLREVATRVSSANPLPSSHRAAALTIRFPQAASPMNPILRASRVCQMCTDLFAAAHLSRDVDTYLLVRCCPPPKPPAAPAYQPPMAFSKDPMSGMSDGVPQASPAPTGRRSAWNQLSLLPD